MKLKSTLFALLLITLVPLCGVSEETATAPLAVTPAEQTADWAKGWWMPRHKQKLAELKQMGTVDLLMVGDSITHS